MPIKIFNISGNNVVGMVTENKGGLAVIKNPRLMAPKPREDGSVGIQFVPLVGNPLEMKETRNGWEYEPTEEAFKADYARAVTPIIIPRPIIEIVRSN
jgi:hypothetical protein